VNLLAQSLRDFSSDAWWSVCNTLIDYESAELWMLTENVRKEVRRGDLLRASASYGNDEGEDEGAELLTGKILAVLAEQAVIEQIDTRWQVTAAYAAIHELPGGAMRFAYNIDGNWTTYDALPYEEREARRQADNDRLNTVAAISAAANYQRPVQTGEERSPKYATARQAAFELYESLLQYGYLDAFPVTINQDGRVVSGNHRLRFAELARLELVAELEHERQNGSDPITVADLERRVASLARDRILRDAVVVTSNADEVKVTTASEIQIPWAEHERKQFAKRLAVDGLSVRQIAGQLGQSERTIREWTAEERTDVKAVQRAEAERLRDAGWTQKRVAEHLGVGKDTVSRWLSDSGKPAKIGRVVSTPETPVASTPEPTESQPDRDTSPLAAAGRQRERLEQVKRLDGRVRPRWTLGDVEDAEAVRRLAGLD